MSEKEVPGEPLPAPQLPQLSSAEVITIHQTEVGQGVFIVITEYSDVEPGDTIDVFWDNELVRSVLVSNPIADTFPLTIVVKEGIDRGAHTCYYTAKDDNDNPNTSIRVGLTIEDTTPPAVIYPPPIFTDAVSGVITQSSLAENSGTHVHVVPYQGIAVNDTVKLFWNGYNASGDSVAADVLTDAVTIAEVSAGITFLIPADKFTLLDQGTASAYYEVWRSGANTGISSASVASVDLSGGNVSDLNMCISTGAVNTDYDSIHVYPYNQGILKGPAGARVTLSTNVPSVVFKESGTIAYTPTLNEIGRASFRLQSTIQGGVSVNAYEVSHPDVSMQKNVTFGPYTRGEGNIKYLNYTTGAPADGLTPCSVYLKTAESSGVKLNAAITKVRVMLTSASGTAVIVGHEGESAPEIILNSDQSAEIDIVSMAAESVSVELSLPESSGSVNRLEMVFVSF